MKKKAFTLLLVVFLLLSGSVFASASVVLADESVLTDSQSAYSANGLPLVVDNADLLTDEQEENLAQDLYNLSFVNNVDVVVLTVNSLNGKSALAFADDYYDYNGYGQGDDRSGMLLLYLPGPQGEREIALSTRGALYACVSDADSDAMIDMLIPDLIDENYAAAFDNYVSFAAEEVAQIGQSSGGPGLLYIPFCLGIGFVAAFIIMKIRTASLTSVRKERSARYYVKEDSLQLTGSRDRFVYKNVTKVAKQTQSSSSGSSGRTSSSGATHGGTSRKF